jgi:chromosome segregation ATPase
MTDGSIKAGSHDKGFWDASNPIKANKTPLASGLSVEQAMAKAKANPGAELVVVNSEGKASVHSLSVEDTFWNENKKILISELDRDPAQKQNVSKTPLAIDDLVAQSLFGQGAFLVDEENKSTFLGNDVDQTTDAVKLKDAEQFLTRPTADRVDAAYAIAKDAGNERHVDKKLATQVLDQLHQDYRQSGPADQQIALIKPGDAKTRMQGLVGELKTLAGQESTRVTELRGQLSDRTEKWQSDLKTPTQQRNAALSAWQSADQRETQWVKTAAYNLREARMPGVHTLEQNLSEAKSHSANMRSQLNNASENRSRAQSRVNDIERLPGEAENHLRQAQQLKSENQGMYLQIQSYTTLTLSQVSSERRSVERDLSRAETDLDIERRKPSQPTGGNNDPSHDPFKPGSGNGNDSHYGKDPFAGSGGDYRDGSRISELERKVSRLTTERRDLAERESSLESVNTRLAFTRDIDQLSMLFYNLDPIDRLALNQYKDRKDSNQRSINDHERQASDKRSTYQREIGGAQRNLAEATSNEEAARSRFGQAESRVAGFEQNLSDLKNNPRPDTHGEVKPKATAYQKAVEHQDATVGAKAPLTVSRDKTQAVVDSLNQAYNGDKHSLESQISNVQQTLRKEAQGKIGNTRAQL